MTELQRRLFELQDKKYQAFHSKLIPNIEPAHVIGIRTPVLRNFAKAFAKEDGAEAFLQELPHTYYEENNLHMMLIGGIRDYAQCLYEVKRMLPYVDNWATCDFPVPKCFAKHKEELLPEIHTFLASGETYTIRYGIGLLMRLYLDDDFRPEYPAMAALTRYFRSTASMPSPTRRRPTARPSGCCAPAERSAAAFTCRARAGGQTGSSGAHMNR